MLALEVDISEWLSVRRLWDFDVPWSWALKSLFTYDHIDYGNVGPVLLPGTTGACLLSPFSEWFDKKFFIFYRFVFIKGY